jgi:hypothetical protein
LDLVCSVLILSHYPMALTQSPMTGASVPLHVGPPRAPHSVGNGWEWGLLGSLLVIMDHSLITKHQYSK